MKVQVLQHVPFEWIGSMEPWLRERGAEITTARLYEAVELPDPASLDLVIAMGGPMSVNDEAEHPWLVPEKAFLREVIKRGVPTIGVCLGGQLIANAHGAAVTKNPHTEIGWFPVEAMPAPKGTFTFPFKKAVYHWHGETFGLPEGASLLASSKGCRNQAFQMGTNVIGMQFHLETTPETAALLIENCGNEIVPGPYVQSAEEMLAATPEQYASINALSGKILDYVLGNTGGEKKRPEDVLYF
ncbi:type 1 glutamine amidotransferase [Ruficoccus sp. ZRK36]|uniref:type 1 glutamine amidotransferase n=1 Tax=Ruficoccus sp. ZRK36 TaxID=2866311 RepID=UPI001C73836E|nr:type 1 glutamine amidotransferase [Ruficoccus sp. ZRK36]QYY34554.1 type 1 glutamine amidotransferase [Ruficoccus sp. ZRK36]